jgi:hypothetical protein
MANNATANFSHISILLYTKNQPESTPNLNFFRKILRRIAADCFSPIQITETLKHSKTARLILERFYIFIYGVSPPTVSPFFPKTKILGKAEDFAILMININIFYPSW